MGTSSQPRKRQQKPSAPVAAAAAADDDDDDDDDDDACFSSVLSRSAGPSASPLVQLQQVQILFNPHEIMHIYANNIIYIYIYRERERERERNLYIWMRC